MARGSAHLRILVVTRSYPSADNLYQYPFVHRRVLAYGAAGNQVKVFRPSAQPVPSEHQFDGVTCTTGDSDALAALAGQWRPDVIASHGFSETQWQALEPLAGRYPIRAWLHGSEIPEIARRKALWDTEGTEQSRGAPAAPHPVRVLAALPCRHARPLQAGIRFAGGGRTGAKGLGNAAWRSDRDS